MGSFVPLWLAFSTKTSFNKWGDGWEFHPNWTENKNVPSRSVFPLEANREWTDTVKKSDLKNKTRTKLRFYNIILRTIFSQPFLMLLAKNNLHWTKRLTKLNGMTKKSKWLKSKSWFVDNDVRLNHRVADDNVVKQKKGKGNVFSEVLSEMQHLSRVFFRVAAIVSAPLDGSGGCWEDGVENCCFWSVEKNKSPGAP